MDRDDVVQSLVQSDDAEVRTIALKRILRQGKLGEEDGNVLRANIPTLPIEDLMTLLARHGDLGCPAQIVERLAADLPEDHGYQFWYCRHLGIPDVLVKLLDADAYADFVQRTRPLVSDMLGWALIGGVRGCSLFNAVVKHDPEWPARRRLGGCEPVAASLLDVRYDESACRARLEARVASADLRELLRLAWVLQAAGRGDLGLTAWRRALDRFAFLTEADTEDSDRILRYYHWEIVRAWVMEPSPDQAERIAWLADRVAEMERRGYILAWDQGGEELPAELRDAIARVLVDRGEVPGWAGPVLVERLTTRSLDAWRAVFSWWSRWDRGWHRFWNHRERKAIVLEAPLPETAPDDFDEAFLRCAGDVIADEQEQIGHFREAFAPGQSPEVSHEVFLRTVGLRQASWLSHHTERFQPLLTVHRIIERLLEMSLSPARAARIARQVKDHPDLLRHPRMVEVAALSGTLEADALPALGAIDVNDAEQVALYRRLGGQVADERLREHVRLSLTESVGEPNRSVGAMRAFTWGWGRWLQEVADGDILATMRSRARDASFAEVTRLHERVPWIVDEALLHEVARKHVDEGRSWYGVNPPRSLLPFVEERARRTEDDRELLRLLAWLAAQDVPRAAQMRIVVARLERGPGTYELAEVAGMLTTRSAWEAEGPMLLQAFARWDDWGVVRQIWMALYEAVQSAPSYDGVLTAVHLVFATVILKLAGVAAEIEDDGRLIGLLTALLQLDPPPPIVRSLRKLAEHPGLSARAKERISSGMKLFKSSEGRQPSFDALLEATAMLRAGAQRTPATPAPADLSAKT